MACAYVCVHVTHIKTKPQTPPKSQPTTTATHRLRMRARKAMRSSPGARAPASLSAAPLSADDETISCGTPRAVSSVRSSSSHCGVASAELDSYTDTKSCRSRPVGLKSRARWASCLEFVGKQQVQQSLLSSSSVP